MEPKSEIIDLDIIANDIQADFGLNIHDLCRIQEGYVNEVYSALNGDKEVIVRIARGRNAYPVEIWAYDKFRSLGIPCPNLISYQEHPIKTKHPTVIMEKVAGHALNQTELSPESESKIYHEVGEILAKVHKIKIQGFGFLIFQEGKLVGDYKTPRKHWESQDTAKHLQYLLQKSLVTESEFQTINDIYKTILETEVQESVFVYNDLHKAHIFTDGERVTGVIDVGNSFSGDPRYDIACTLFFLDQNESSAFKEGYGKLAEDPMVSKYLIFITALKSGWRHKDGNLAGSEKALTKLKRLLYY